MKKNLLLLIYYTHKLTKNLIHDNKCQQNKQQIRLFHFPHSLTHICIPNKTSFMQVKRVELTLSASSVGGENKNKTKET